MNEKHQFIIPAVIFTVVVSIMAAYGFIQAQIAGLDSAGKLTAISAAIGAGASMGGAGTITTTGAIITNGGVVLNNGGAVNGLLVPNGNVGIGTSVPNAKLVIDQTGTNQTGVSSEAITAYANNSVAAIHAIQNGTGMAFNGWTNNSNNTINAQQAGSGNAIGAYANNLNSAVYAQQDHYLGYAVYASGPSRFSNNLGSTAVDILQYCPGCYAIHVVGGKSYFSGNVGLGVTDPQSRLTAVNGAGAGTAGRSDASIYGDAINSQGIGVYGVSSGSGAGIYGYNASANGYAGQFMGQVYVDGTVTSIGTYQYNSKYNGFTYPITSERYVFDLLPEGG